MQFVRLNVDELPDLGEKYRVTALPYFIFLKKQSIEERFDSSSQERWARALRVCVCVCVCVLLSDTLTRRTEWKPRL